MSHKKSAILVTGCPRSGSTVLAGVLSFAPTTGYVEEPLNVQTGLIGTSEHFVHLEDSAKTAQEYDEIIQKMFAGFARYKHNELQPKTTNPLRKIYRYTFVNRYQIDYSKAIVNPFTKVLIWKDPTAVFSAQYLLHHYPTSVILTVRHPCGVIASHQRLGWGSPLEIFLKKKSLHKYFSNELKNLNTAGLNETQSHAWAWRVIYEVLTHFAKEDKKMVIVEHENFSSNPIVISKKLYKLFDLPFTDRVQQKLSNITNEHNPTDPKNNEIHSLKRNSRANIDRWKSILTPTQHSQILAITNKTYQEFIALSNNLK